MYYCPNCKVNLKKEKNKLICGSNYCTLRGKAFKISWSSFKKLIIKSKLTLLFMIIVFKNMYQGV